MVCQTGDTKFITKDHLRLYDVKIHQVIQFHYMYFFIDILFANVLEKFSQDEFHKKYLTLPWNF